MSRPAARDPNICLPAEHEWPHLPANFAVTVKSKVKVELTYDQLHEIDLIVGRHSMTRAKRVAGFDAAVEIYADRSRKLAEASAVIDAGHPVKSIPTIRYAGPDESSRIIDVARLKDELSYLADFYKRAADGNSAIAAPRKRPRKHYEERNALWEALFVAWVAVLGQEIRLRQHGVVEFIQIVSEHVGLKGGHRATEIIGFWNGNAARRARIATKAAAHEIYD